MASAIEFFTGLCHLCGLMPSTCKSQLAKAGVAFPGILMETTKLDVVSLAKKGITRASLGGTGCVAATAGLNTEVVEGEKQTAVFRPVKEYAVKLFFDRRP